jgi:hypothetical protein
MKRYKVLYRRLVAWQRSVITGNTVWREKWHDKIKEIMQSSPHGSGFDSGTYIDLEASKGKLVFNTSFHHMNEVGYYVGWTKHKVIIKPLLEYDFIVTVTGRDCNQIKDYIADVFSVWLEEEIEEY